MFDNSFTAMPKKRKLTTQLDEETYAEFAAATLVLRARNISALVHGFVIETIRKAKAMTSEEEFAQIVLQQKEEIEQHSKKKSRESRRLQGVPASTIKLKDVNDVKERSRGNESK